MSKTVTGAPAKARILVVDDAPDALLLARRALRHAGHEVITATSGAQAEERWAEGAPDLVLLDVNLPDANGVELSNRWKQTIDRMAVPVILWSSVSVSAAEQALGLDSGADGYLIDPVEPEVLAATVAAHLRIAELIDDLDRASTEATELVRYSLALGQCETPDQVLDVLDATAQRALGARTVRLEWRHVQSGAVRSHRIGNPTGVLSGLIAEQRETRRLEAWFEDDLAVLPFHVVGADGHLAIAGADDRPFDLRRRQFSIAFTNVTSLSLARVEALHLHRTIADTLQQALLPTVRTLPGLRHHQALLVAEGATIAGGDWSDGYPIDTPDGPRQILAVGDVVGHGARAAGVSAVFRHSLRALLLSGVPVADVMATLGQVLQDHPDEPKGTLVLVEYDPATGDGRLFSAGHLPPVLFRRSGAVVVDLEPCPPLGYGLSGSCHAVPFHLDVGDALVLFTDGVVERRGQIVDAGYDRLIAHVESTLGDDGLPPKHGIVGAVRAMLGSEVLEDDALVVCIRRIDDDGDDDPGVPAAAEEGQE